MDRQAEGIAIPLELERLSFLGSTAFPGMPLFNHKRYSSATQRAP